MEALLLIVFIDGTLGLTATHTGELLGEFAGAGEVICSVDVCRLASDTSRALSILIGYADGAVYLMSAGEARRTLNTEGLCISVAFSSNGKHFLIGYADGAVSLDDTVTVVEVWWTLKRHKVVSM